MFHYYQGCINHLKDIHKNNSKTVTHSRHIVSIAQHIQERLSNLVGMGGPVGGYQRPLQDEKLTTSGLDRYPKTTRGPPVNLHH